MPTNSDTAIRRTLELLHERGAVFEIRAPRITNAKRGTVSGYFNDFDAAARAARTLNGAAEGVYVTLNPVSPELLARANNQLKDWVKHTTQDVDIIQRHWLLLDIDPVRKAGISSTDAEHEEALERARKVREWLTSEGWPAPILADSGNGAHVLCRIDLPNDAASYELVRRVTEAVAVKFDDERVIIDRGTTNAARIVRIHGTLAQKGDTTADRPHRVSKILEVPKWQATVLSPVNS